MRTDPSQGEALGAWALWGAVTLAVLITYSLLDATELYTVSHEGLAGGLGRALVLLNFPIALVAVALALLAVAALSAKAWLVAAPAIALCAIVPFAVDHDDLNARFPGLLDAVLTGERPAAIPPVLAAAGASVGAQGVAVTQLRPAP